MGTIAERRKANGKPSYTAQIRKKKKGKIVVNLVETFATRKAAEAWVKRQETRLRCPDQFRLAANEKARKSLRDVIIAYKEACDLDPGSTKVQVLDAICRMEFSNDIATDLTAAAIVSFARDLKIGVQPDPKDSASASPDHYALKPRASSTVMHYLVTLGTVLRYGGVYADVKLPLEEYEEAMRSLRHVKTVAKSRKRNRRPTLDEIDRLMDFFYTRYQEDKRRVPMHKIVAAAIFKCHRQGEIVRAKWSDFDKKKKNMTIRDLKNPRGTKGNDVSVLVAKEARKIVKSMPRLPGEDRVFPYHKDTVCRLFTEACKMLGIEDLHFHDLRHDGISRLFEIGMDVAMVAKHTGHKSWQTLERYTHIEKRTDKYDGWKWWEVVTAPL